MHGETDLDTLLDRMAPVLDARRFAFCSVDEETARRVDVSPLGTFREDEGITLILESSDAEALGLQFAGHWAKITLTIHSDLTAVGFLAVVAARLAAEGIPSNAVSAFYHDHLFVPWDARDRALASLLSA